VDAHQHAEHARRELGLPLDALWVDYLALGGAATRAQLGRYLSDGTGFSGREHDYVAQALNDHFIGLGGDHPVPYADSFRDTL